MDVVSAPIVIILMVSTTAVQSQITSGPVNALKKVGDSCSLECVTSSNKCEQIGWTKMEGAQSARTVYTSGMILSGFPGERYSVSSTGGCNLTIRKVEVNDSGRFSCVLTMGDMEETRGSVLVAINVTESCRSNVTSNALNQNDGYSFSTVINVPAKSVEPSDVFLSFQNKTAAETNTMDTTQPLTVRATLTGIARKENIAQRVCTASLPPNTAADYFDRSTATLIVCTTQQLIVSYPVENIDVSYEDATTKESSPSPTGSYYKGATVRCTAEGYPNPTFKWTSLKNGKVVSRDDTLVIDGEVGDNYTCTATNTFKGKTAYLNITITVTVVSPPEPDPGCGSICIGLIVVGVVVVTGATVVTGFIVSKRKTDK